MSEDPGSVLLVGEALIDIVRRVESHADHSHWRDEQMHPGGSPANVAVGLAQLDHLVDFATWIGPDQHGQWIARHLSDKRVRLVEGSDRADLTPTALAYVDPDGLAQYDFDLTWHLPPIDPRALGHLHTGSIAATCEPGASAVLELMLAAREYATVSYDPNLRPSIMGEAYQVRSRIEECIGASDVVKASEEDVDGLYPGALLETVARLWSRLGPELIVITRGGEGALVHLGGSGEQFTSPAEQVSVQDTVGAGDSFMAGLLSGLLDAGLLGDAQARQRLRSATPDQIRPVIARGLATGAYTVQRAGAVAPTRCDLGLE